MRGLLILGPVLGILSCIRVGAAEEAWWKPYSPPCVERENVFEFAEKPAVKVIGQNQYQITFAVKSNCDVTVSIVDPSQELVPGRGTIVRHLASGVLGQNAPAPFQKDSLRQTLLWNGRDGLGEYPDDMAKPKIRVSLGLKPEFDKHLGGTSPMNLSGWVNVLAADESGIYVWTKGNTGRGRDAFRIKRFDHDGKYVRTLLPPSDTLTDEKRNGYGYVEYEPGKRSLHGPRLYRSIMRFGFYHIETSLDLSGGTHEVFERASANLRPQVAVSNGQIFYLTAGVLKSAVSGKKDAVDDAAPTLHYLDVGDGSSDYEGVLGRRIGTGSVRAKRSVGLEWYPMGRYRMVASPGGKWLYITGICKTIEDYMQGAAPATQNLGFPAVLRCATDGKGVAELFVGELGGRGGAKEDQLMTPRGLDCDSQGRVYVADSDNNQIKVFSEEGKHLSNLPVSGPWWVAVHKKTGDVFVLHNGPAARKGSSRDVQLTKFSPFPAFKQLHSVNMTDLVHGGIAVAALDSWSQKPRLWFGRPRVQGELGMNPYPGRLIVFEEEGGGLRKLLDFDEAARQADAATYCCPWLGSTHQNNLACNPAREHVYWRLTHVFDLSSGRQVGNFLPPDTDATAISPFNYRGLMLWDARFCKRGYMHVVFGSAKEAVRGLVRLDPRDWIGGEAADGFPECPYDYGNNCGGSIQQAALWMRGMLEIPCQDYRPWTPGLGVNMRGDIAAAMFIGYAPKMEASSVDKFERTGRLRQKDAMISGPCPINGLDIEEDGMLYFACSGVRIASGTRNADGSPFLAGRAGNYGREAPYSGNRSPLTGVYMKTRGSDVRFLTQDEALPSLPMQEHEIPDRHHDLIPSETRDIWWHCAGGRQYGDVDAGSEDFDPRGRVWVKDAEWIYAGCSPIGDRECYCAQSRPHLDWYKRSFVPEMYRHSFAALDTNGNLILHFGRYGNYDDAMEATAKDLARSEDGATICFTDQIAGTDNYLVYCDYGARLVVLKLNYHAEETAGIPGRSR